MFTPTHPTTAGESSILVIDFGLTLIALAFAFCWPLAGSSRIARFERAIGRVARRRVLSVLLVGCATGLLRLLMLPIVPIPKPFIQDDFSFLLAAQTFASGRITNPTHPMWVHFESFHITQQPTYMSMYFPAQGMVMAAGKLLAGHPWYGIWASAAIMCAAICWMLQAWLPPGWALLGGMLAVLRIGLFSYWMNTYTGGAVAAIGGALVLGSLPRIRRSFRTRDFFWMALGLAILGNSRPYEGLLVSIPALSALAWWLVKKPHPPGVTLVRRISPGAALLAATLVFMAYYNHRVFGNVFTPPYAVNRATYAVAPHFFWQSARPEPVYRHREMREFYTDTELSWYKDMQSPRGFVLNNLRKLGMGVVFYFGFVLLIPFVMLPKAVRDRRIRFLVITGGIFGLGLFAETWLLPHYVAPFAAGVYAILLQCMRHLHASKRNRPSPKLFLARAIPTLCFALALLGLYMPPLTLQPFTAYGNAPLGLQRAQVLSGLEKQPGRQLAIVRYSADHDVSDEWVYNAADINGSKVVWAREMDPQSNRQLLRYFEHRQAWLIEPDFNPPKVASYPQSEPTPNVALASQSGPLRSREP